MASDGPASSPLPPPPSPKDSVTQTLTLTDCPHCWSLCLGPSILPCGHVLCRRCLHDVLPPRGDGCPQCGHPLHSLPKDQAGTSNLVTLQSTDPVVEQLVYQKLKGEDIHCLNCPNKQATNACLDCHEYYCQPCSANHRRSRLGRNHLLRLLPRALMNSSSVAWDSSKRKLSSSSSSSAALPASSVDAVIQNTADSQSRDASAGGREGLKAWRELVKEEVDHLQQASSEHEEMETTLQDILSLGQQLMNGVKTHRQLLETYRRHLSCLDVTQQRTAPATYVINVHGYDVGMDVTTEDLKRRLCEVRNCRQCLDVNGVRMMRRQLHQLLQSADQEHSATINSISSPRTPTPSSSSTHTPTTPDPYPSPSQSTLPITPTTYATFSVDLMTTSPKRVYTSSPTSAEDVLEPRIRAVTCLPEDRLVLTDFNNDKVKVMNSAPPYAISSSLDIPERPWGLGLLPDGLVAVTTYAAIIYLLRVKDSIAVISRIQTGRQYLGVAGGHDGCLLTSCGTSPDGPAAVDVLNRQGLLVRRLTDSLRVPDLRSPDYLCNSGDGHVLVSDCDSHTVYKISTASGQVTDALQNSLMIYPRQVCADKGGHVLVTSGDGHCVLVRGQGGRWRQLLVPSFHRGSWYDYPTGVCFTRSGLLVVTWAKGLSDTDSMVIAYEFK